MFERFLSEDDGITAIEYGLIGTLVMVSATVAMREFGRALEDNLYEIIQAMAATIS